MRCGQDLALRAGQVLLFVSLLFVGIAPVLAESRSLLLLYTNDLHGYFGAKNGRYAQQIEERIKGLRSQRDDTLLLDAGDLMARGGRKAALKHELAAFNRMARMKYDALTLGNHDLAYPSRILKGHLGKINLPVVCANCFLVGRELDFPGTVVVERNGLKIGVVGLTVTEWNVSFMETVTLMRQAIDDIYDQSDLVIVLAHLDPVSCALLSQADPRAAVFVSGHSHTVLFKPQVVPRTNALVVQAGAFGRYFGVLELEVVLKTGQASAVDGFLVEIMSESQNRRWRQNRRRQQMLLRGN